MNANIVGLFVGIILALVTIYLILSGNKKSNSSIEPKNLANSETFPETIPQKELPSAPAVMETRVPVDNVAPTQEELPAAQAVEETRAPVDSATIPQEVSPVAPAVMQAQMPVQADDLTLVEGIGPKIAGILKLQGIMTFAQLASTDIAMLTKVLHDNGLQFAKPNSWPEQARLAAEGKMDELKALQDKLIAGR